MTNEKHDITIKKKRNIRYIGGAETNMDAVTKNVAEYVKRKRINLSAMSRDTGISYMALYDSLVNTERDREIRGRELLAVCDFLGVNPMDFADKPEKKIV